MIFQNEKTFFQAIKRRSLKSRKIVIFSQGLPRVLVQKQPFLQLFFKAIQAIKMSFIIFQNEKTVFQAIKTRTSKNRKIDTFPEGLTHGFRPKIAFFSIFLFQAIQARKMSFIILQNEKTPCQAIKTGSSKSRKIDIFPSELTHGFGPIMVVSSTFFFQAIQARKMSFMIFQNEKTHC